MLLLAAMSLGASFLNQRYEVCHIFVVPGDTCNINYLLMSVRQKAVRIAFKTVNEGKYASDWFV